MTFTKKLKTEKPQSLGLDDTPLTFGVHRDQTPNQVAAHAPSYIVWMHKNVKNFPTCTQDLVDRCEEQIMEDDHEYQQIIEDDRHW